MTADWLFFTLRKCDHLICSCHLMWKVTIQSSSKIISSQFTMKSASSYMCQKNVASPCNVKCGALETFGKSSNHWILEASHRFFNFEVFEHQEVSRSRLNFITVMWYQYLLKSNLNQRVSNLISIPLQGVGISWPARQRIKHRRFWRMLKMASWPGIDQSHAPHGACVRTSEYASLVPPWCPATKRERFAWWRAGLQFPPSIVPTTRKWRPVASGPHEKSALRLNPSSHTTT